MKDAPLLKPSFPIDAILTGATIRSPILLVPNCRRNIALAVVDTQCNGERNVLPFDEYASHICGFALVLIIIFALAAFLDLHWRRPAPRAAYYVPQQDTAESRRD